MNSIVKIISKFKITKEKIVNDIEGSNVFSQQPLYRYTLSLRTSWSLVFQVLTPKFRVLEDESLGDFVNLGCGGGV